jgi:16S rRNA (guanine527-N7)-methyltransferase
MDKCREILIEGLAFFRTASPLEDWQFCDENIELLLQFMSLIEKWNKAYNLTAIRNKEEMARLHMLDSLAILPHLHGQRLIDIGTGAGLPGIPLAIFRPDMEFVLLDSNAKKTRFVQQVILELKLKNVSVLHSRVETYQPIKRFDSVVSRAFTNLSDMIRLTEHLLNENGLLLAMKGQSPHEELAELNQSYQVIPILVPQVDAERCLISICANC